MKKHNFSAGPCILPQEVLKQASDAILNFNNDNLSLIEISHRSKPFVAVMSKAIDLVKQLLSVPKGYSVLFLQALSFNIGSLSYVKETFAISKICFIAIGALFESMRTKPDNVFKNKLKGKYIITSVTFKLTKKNHILNTAYGVIEKEP